MAETARVLIVGTDHPWKNHSGELVGAMNTIVGPMGKVLLDNGIECGVKGKDLILLEAKYLITQRK